MFNYLTILYNSLNGSTGMVSVCHLNGPWLIHLITGTANSIHTHTHTHTHTRLRTGVKINWPIRPLEEGIEEKKISEKNMKNVTFIHRICPIYSWAGSIGKGDVTEYGRELRKMKLIKTCLLSSKTLISKQLN